VKLCIRLSRRMKACFEAKSRSAPLPYKRLSPALPRRNLDRRRARHREIVWSVGQENVGLYGRLPSYIKHLVNNERRGSRFIERYTQSMATALSHRCSRFWKKCKKPD
jgi:hypothetical protein